MDTERMGGERLAGLSAVRTALNAWRARKRGRKRIPPEIWQAAAREARRHGLSRVRQVLRVNYATLKRHTHGERERVAGGTEEEFVELATGRADSGGGCLVEVQKPNGTRLRVRVPGPAGIDWSKLKEAFLEA
jgi:hypothetical protein